MLSNAIIKLIKSEPFYAHFIQGLKRHYTTDIATCGVNVTESINLWVNPFFWNSLTLEEQVDILKHEVGHVLNNHFTRFKELEPSIFEEIKVDKNTTVGDVVIERLKKNAKFSNLNKSADYALNEYLPNLPKVWNMFDKNGNIMVEPDTILDQSGKEVPNPNAGKPITCEPCLVEKHKGWARQKHTEYYYNMLRQEQQKNGGGSGQGLGGEVSIDDHSIWAEGSQDSEYVLEKIKQAVNKAADAAKNSGAGNIPSDVQVLIDKLNYKPRDWRSELQRIVARTSEMLIESSRKIRNRRYGIQYAGNKTFPKLHLAVAVDTSGSVSDEALCQFLAEIDKIEKQGASVTIIEADCKVQAVYKYDPRKTVKFSGRGGTAYQPALSKAEELEVDALFYFGDMDSADKPKKPKFPVTWCIVGDQKPPANFGNEVRIKVEKKI